MWNALWWGAGHDKHEVKVVGMKRMRSWEMHRQDGQTMLSLWVYLRILPCPEKKEAHRPWPGMHCEPFPMKMLTIRWLASPSQAFLCVFMYVCAYGCLCTYVHVCAGMQKQEADRRCLSQLLSSLIFGDKVFYWRKLTFRLFGLTSLAESLRSSCLVPTSTHLSFPSAHGCWGSKLCPHAGVSWTEPSLQRAYLLVFCWCFVWKQDLTYSGESRTSYVAKDGHELLVLLLLSSEGWDFRGSPLCSV